MPTAGTSNAVCIISEQALSKLTSARIMRTADAETPLPSGVAHQRAKSSGIRNVVSAAIHGLRGPSRSSDPPRSGKVTAANAPPIAAYRAHNACPTTKLPISTRVT